MGQKIYTIGTDGKLSELEQSPYESEALLQSLLADHPQLLGHTAGSDAGVLLIRREQPVPATRDGGERWSLDHLFVDADAVPILLEVKRASDTRIRREVVGQMLDYAANGVAYWPIQHLIDMYRDTCMAQGVDADERLSAFLGAERSPEGFWKQLEANLRAGRVRMVFLADAIPPELQRIIEFLNEQLNPAEVLAIEVRQYVAKDGAKTLVPTLLGATERAQAAKAVDNRPIPVNAEEWLAIFSEKFGAQTADLARRLSVALQQLGFTQFVLKDSLRFSMPASTGRAINPFYIRLSIGSVEVWLESLSRSPAYAEESSRQALLNRLKQLPGTNIVTSKLTGIPTFSIKALSGEDAWNQFIEIAREIRGKLSSSSAD